MGWTAVGFFFTGATPMGDFLMGVTPGFLVAIVPGMAFFVPMGWATILDAADLKSLIWIVMLFRSDVECLSSWFLLKKICSVRLLMNLL